MTTVCFYHATYALHYTLWLMHIKELLARNMCDIWKVSDPNWIQTHNNLVHKQTISFLKNRKRLFCNLRKFLYCTLIIQLLKLSWFSGRTLCRKCPYSKLFWSVPSHIRIISPYSVRMRENTDQDNSEYGHLSRSDNLSLWSFTLTLYEN